MRKEVKVYLSTSDMDVLSQAYDILFSLKDLGILSGIPTPTINDIGELGNRANIETDGEFYCPILETISIKRHSLYIVKE